jgi:carbonic anhydrase
MKTNLGMGILAVGFFIFGCSPQASQESISDSSMEENEVKATAPDAETEAQRGYVLPGLDHGLSQSPININSTADGTGKHSITLNFKDEVNKIENLGHTVQLDFQEGSSITQDDTTFAFKQCHFHTPSEHLIDGMTFPMEMHIVNLMPNEDKDATPQYLVIGVLFKEGKENRFVADFLDAIPAEEGGSEDLPAGKVKLADLFGSIPKEVKGHYYNYKGSLTTPPYTESVRWYITKHIFEASAEQIEAINKIEGNNARHVQALYGRTVATK